MTSWQEARLIPVSGILNDTEARPKRTREAPSNASERRGKVKARMEEHDGHDRLHVSIFDYETTPTNPYGQGIRQLIEGLRDEMEITVYSASYPVEGVGSARFVRVPAIQRPLAVLYVTFFIAAPLTAWWDQRRHGQHPHIRQSLESAIPRADVLNVMFCHRSYLRDHWKTSRPSGLRRAARWIFEQLAALSEGPVLSRAKAIVVPSAGFARELIGEYPALADRIHVVPNAIAWKEAQRPADFDRPAFRSKYGIPTDAIVLTFVALGHFERKGLPLVFDSMRRVADQRVHIVVVGGTPDLVSIYRRRAGEAGLGDQVTFVGNQADVKRFHWAADGFIFPSAYETFSYASFEAAAAGVPLVVSDLYGVQDIAVDGENALIVERTAESIGDAIKRLIDLGPDGRARMGARAREAVRDYDVDSYVRGWRTVYRRLAASSV